MTGCRSAVAAVLSVLVFAIGTAVWADPAVAANKPAPLTVLVTNDDGVSAPGIDTLVQALRTMKNTKVVVVAPASNQSGAGSKTTPGSLTTQFTRTASGYAATAVQGYPADAVVVALDSLQVKPSVVISGINTGQNLGPAVEHSGTVGAAKQAVQRGIPALAVSQGIGEPQYGTGAKLALEWLKEHRAALSKKPKTEPTTLDNLNVPNCPGGKTRGVVRVPSAPESESADALRSTVDCTAPVTSVSDDVQAFNHGYATLTVVPAS